MRPKQLVLKGKKKNFYIYFSSKKKKKNFFKNFFFFIFFFFFKNVILKYFNGLSVLGNSLRFLIVPYIFTPIAPNPIRNNQKNRFLHIVINLKNITASNPIFSINSSSFDDNTGLSHENIP